jgi:cell division protein DivIC
MARKKTTPARSYQPSKDVIKTGKNRNYILSLVNIVRMKFLPFLKNKFVIAAVAFTAWLLFFDKNDFFVQKERRCELRELQASKAYYQGEIAAERKFAEELKTNPATIEKFAREKYGMKRDNEDLFLVEPAISAEKQ